MHLEYFPRVKDVFGIEIVFDHFHDRDQVSVFFLEEGLFTESYSMFPGARSPF